MFVEAVHSKSPRDTVFLKTKTDVPIIKNVTFCENYRCGILSFWSIFIWNITLHFAKFVVVEFGVFAQFIFFMTKNKTKKRCCKYLAWKTSHLVKIIALYIGFLLNFCLKFNVTFFEICRYSYIGLLLNLYIKTHLIFRYLQQKKTM